MTNQNAREVLSSLASTVTVYRPYHTMLQVGQGLNTYHNLWHGVCEEHIVQLYDKAYPDVTRLEGVTCGMGYARSTLCSSLIKPTLMLQSWKVQLYSSCLTMRRREWRERGWLSSYKHGWHHCGLISSSNFFTFLTASNAILPIQVLRVVFNSTDGFGSACLVVAMVFD